MHVVCVYIYTICMCTGQGTTDINVHWRSKDAQQYYNSFLSFYN